jgi:hypothetical protein
MLCRVKFRACIGSYLKAPKNCTFRALSRILAWAEGVVGLQIKCIDSRNCRLVAVYGELGGYRFLRLAETILERVLRGYVGYIPGLVDLAIANLNQMNTGATLCPALPVLPFLGMMIMQLPTR